MIHFSKAQVFTMSYAPVANGLFWLAGWAGARQKLILGSMTFWSFGLGWLLAGVSQSTPTQDWPKIVKSRNFYKGSLNEI